MRFLRVLKSFRLREPEYVPFVTRSGLVRWDYDPHEIIADGIVHLLGIALSVIAVLVLLALAAIYATTTAQLVSVAVYAAGLVAMLAISASYNLWPVSPAKWVLRSVDHSAIFVLIAATYTPFLAKLHDGFIGAALLIGVWSVAILGIGLKILMPGRFEKLSIGLYLAMGWSGVVAYDSLSSSLPSTTMWFICAGGALYTFGVIFHAWQRLRFQNAIWHSFVLAAAACHYMAVLALVLVSG
ncbi:MAG: hemolysin III family protein [Bradyrhizobiaceae bacterium]|nr:MAG: hemolysin III family protein [Bradyrhizobiaceae bacterium]